MKRITLLLLNFLLIASLFMGVVSAKEKEIENIPAGDEFSIYSDVDLLDRVEELKEENELLVEIAEQLNWFKNNTTERVTLNDIDEQTILQYNLTEDDELFKEIFEHTFEGIEVIITDTSNHETLSLEEYLDLAALDLAPANVNTVTILYHLDNNITSSQLTYTATYSFYTGTKPSSISIKTYVASGPLKWGAKTQRATNNHTLRNVGQTASVTASARTDFWQGGFEATINYVGLPFSKHSAIGEPYLYNKKAALYPTWYDSHSGYSIFEPARADWAPVPVGSRVKWGSTERKAYVNWYKLTFGPPPFNIDDGYQYEIHHIKPREYGGTNDPGNLIPLPYSYHRQVVNVWWNAY